MIVVLGGATSMLDALGGGQIIRGDGYDCSWIFTMTAAMYNLVRLTKLTAQPA
jgi:hypothetical protein